MAANGAEKCTTSADGARPRQTVDSLGDQIAASAAAFDTWLSDWLKTVGEIVSASGRRRRLVPPAKRALLELRDGGCQFPGCVRRHGLHAHHIDHWVHGGETDPENLTLLCHFHHAPRPSRRSARTLRCPNASSGPRPLRY